MSVQPRTKEICWKLIAKQEGEIKLLSDALHELSDEAQAALMQKDRQRVEMCKTCGRRLRR